MVKEGCQLRCSFGVTWWLMFQGKFTFLSPIQWPTHHEPHRDERCQQAAWRAFLMRRISKGKQALAAVTIINKMVSSQLLGCECPAEAAPSSWQCCDLTGFIPQGILSQGWNHPPAAHTGVLGYVHQALRVCSGEGFFTCSLGTEMYPRKEHSENYFLSICLFGRAPVMSG